MHFFLLLNSRQKLSMYIYNTFNDSFDLVALKISHNVTSKYTAKSMWTTVYNVTSKYTAKSMWTTV